MAHDPSIPIVGLAPAASLRIGSDEHKTLFCRQFIDSYI